MDLSASRASMDVARMKAKSVLEQQRIAAMYSGDFYRQILPVMYDASIIDQERFLALMAVRDIQTALSTRELIELAISWGVTVSAQEFWKRHKSREELIRALQQKKSDMEMAAKLAEQQLVTSPADAERAARKQESKDGKKRRSSLVILGELFTGKEVMGDIFGSKGEYTDGIIYMARRIRMDSDSAVELAAKKKAATAMAHAARAKARARRSSIVGGQEERKVVEETLEDEEYLDIMGDDQNNHAQASPGSPGGGGPLSGVAGAVSQPSSPRQKGQAAGGAAGGDFSLNGKKGGAAEESGEAARMRANSKGGFLNPINEGAEDGDDDGAGGAGAGGMYTGAHDASITSNSIEGENSVEDGSPMMMQEGGAIRVKERDGKLHRIGSTRFPMAAHGGHEQNFSGVESNEGSQVDGHHGNKGDMKPMQKMERMMAHRQNTMNDLNLSAKPSGAGASTVSGGRSMLSGGGSGYLEGGSSVADVHAFIAKHTKADEDDAEEAGGMMMTFGRGASSPMGGGPRSPAKVGSHHDFSSSPMSPGGSSSAGSADGSSGGVEDYLPGKLSKLDLYYRPVNDAEKMVVVIPSAASQQHQHQMSPGGHRGAHGDALDTFVASGRRPLSGRTGHANTVGGHAAGGKSPTSPNGPAATRTFISMSPAVSPDGHMSLEPLALRHRLGGRAGKLAREFSEKVKSELPTSDIHLVSPVTSGGEPMAMAMHTRMGPYGGAANGSYDFENGVPSHNSSQNHQQLGGSGFIPEHAPAPLRSSPLKGGATGGQMRGPLYGSEYEGAGGGGHSSGEEDVDAAVLAQGTSPLTKVLGEYIDLASRSRPANAEGRDLQFDAVAKQVDRIRTETMKAQSSQRLQETYGAGAKSPGGKGGSKAASPVKGHR